jgi:hypothetical protein
VARVAYGMAIASENVSAEIIDWEDFKKLGREHRVSTVPKTFINYRKPFVGTLPELSILEKIMEEQLLP